MSTEEINRRSREHVAQFRQQHPELVKAWQDAQHGNRRFVAIEIEHLPRAAEEYPIRRWTLAQRCPCGVAGCNPAGIPECSKGIRERRELP